MTKLGHNERSFRLDALAAEAREGLANVEKGEEFTIGGWLAYGHALNEGRALFPGDKEFGEWVRLSNLDERSGQEVHPGDRQAAMWAAANADQFDEARQRGNPRTIRGIHAKWKEIEAERAEEQRRLDAEAKLKADQEQVAASEANENRAEHDESPEALTSQSKPEQETPPNHADAAVTAEAFDGGASGAGDLTPDPATNTAPEPEPTPDPYGYAKLTEDALLDLANGLRADLEDEKAKRKAAEAEAKTLRSRLKELEADDKNEVVRRLQAEVKNAGNAKWKALEDRDAYHRQVHALKKRLAELEREEVPLN